MPTTFAELRRRARIRLLEPYVLHVPGAPLVSPQGTPATTDYSYAVVARNATGTSKGSASGVTSTGAATLNGTNYNQLTWTAVPGAESYDIYRVASDGLPSSLGLIGNTTDVSFDDTGLDGDASALPTVNTSGVESPFWTEDDLHTILCDGARDLWRAIIDLHRNHFAVIDTTNMSYAADATEITGVPDDCFRILSIEPRDLTDSGSFRNTVFRPRPMQSAAFQAKRAQSTASYPGISEFLYDLINAGSPVDAPSIVVAPRTSSAIPLRVNYVRTLGTLLETDSNPIPGESDNALVAWCVAYARSSERDDRMPDPAWLAIYATDKQGLLTALTPRQEQEPEVIEDLFGGAWWNQ